MKFWNVSLNYKFFSFFLSTSFCFFRGKKKLREFGGPFRKFLSSQLKKGPPKSHNFFLPLKKQKEMEKKKEKSLKLRERFYNFTTQVSHEANASLFLSLFLCTLPIFLSLPLSLFFSLSLFLLLYSTILTAFLFYPLRQRSFSYPKDNRNEIQRKKYRGRKICFRSRQIFLWGREICLASRKIFPNEQICQAKIFTHSSWQLMGRFPPDVWWDWKSSQVPLILLHYLLVLFLISI